MKRNNIAWLLYGTFIILVGISIPLAVTWCYSLILTLSGLAGATLTAYIFGDELRKSVKDEKRE